MQKRSILKTFLKILIHSFVLSCGIGLQLYNNLGYRSAFFSNFLLILQDCTYIIHFGVLTDHVKDYAKRDLICFRILGY